MSREKEIDTYEYNITLISIMNIPENSENTITIMITQMTMVEKSDEYRGKQ